MNSDILFVGNFELYDGYYNGEYKKLRGQKIAHGNGTFSKDGQTWSGTFVKNKMESYCKYTAVDGTVSLGER